MRDLSLTRRDALKGALAAGGAIAFPMISRGSYAFAAAPGRRYSARAVKVVRESLVVDMLALLKLDFDPKFFDQPFGPGDLADFKASGITGFHHSIGIEDP